MEDTAIERSDKMRIRDWKGLLHEEPRKVKRTTFLALFVLAVSMIFTQLGFMGLGYGGQYSCYLMGLLVPVSATALLLGKGAGALQGFLSGLVLFAHAMFQPLNVIERFFVGITNSVVLFTFAGFLLGLLYAIALRKEVSRVHRVIRLVVVSYLASLFTTFIFFVNVILEGIFQTFWIALQTQNYDAELSHDFMAAVDALGDAVAEFALNGLLLVGTALIVDALVRKYREGRGAVSVRVSFGTRLFAVVSLAFCVLSAAVYIFITANTAESVSADMRYDADFILSEVDESSKQLAAALSRDDMQNISDEAAAAIFDSSYMQVFISGYNLDTYGTVVVFGEDEVLYSNSPAYPVGAHTGEIYGKDNVDFPFKLAQSDRMLEILYDTRPLRALDDTGNWTVDLGFARAVQLDDMVVMIAKPFGLVFAERRAMMAGSTILSFVLLALVYVLTARLLGKGVVGPIDRTNSSLAKITQGDLDERVDERENVEFVSLSEGINDTVDALKGYIAEAETRMEVELNTAKAIQKSALPRVFPPFPEVEQFDIFASMDAAKEVGGDFYDYFLLDDHTLGFLIADVSGKGVPGALFMMSSKTELENYMAAGMELSQAIATANKRLCTNNDAGMFVTAWAGMLDYETGELTYVNAGHNYPLLRHGFGGEWEWLKEKGGLILGTFDTAKYEQHTITLQPGDELLLYTDGVNEAFNVDGEEYGNQRLESFLAAHADMHSREIVLSLRADVARWAEGAEQSDDVTILAIEYGVKPEVTGTVTMPAKLENLATVTDFINAELVARLCPVDVQHKVEMALEELFVNVCRYAYADQDEPGDVKVSYAYGTNPSSITIELRDHGIPFDPIKREDPTKPASAQEATIGGLGIYMVRQMMDDFNYMRRGNTNVVVIKKGW